MRVASGAQQSLLRPTTTTFLFFTLPLTITCPSSSGPFPQSQPVHLCGNEAVVLLTPGSSKAHLWTPGCRSQLSLLHMHSCGCWGWWQGHIQRRSCVSHTASCSRGDCLQTKRLSEGITDEKCFDHISPTDPFLEQNNVVG